MNVFRAYLFSSVLVAFLVLATAVQPAAAQQDQAKHVYHRQLPAGKTCSDCHKLTYAQWKDSPHGVAGVECSVCHGETTAPDFAGTPALSTCATCHSDQVAQVKTDPFMKNKTCVNCHQAHAFAEHKQAAAPAK